MSIKALPEDVIAQIKSSTTITSLNGVLFELMKNSLDAGSTKIDISVDYSRGGCVVEDDGLGILPAEFSETGGLGKLYHSSKLHFQNPVHGGRGTFLASLSAMCLLSITSHHHMFRSYNTLSMHKSQVVSRQVPAPAQHCLSRPSHGTRIMVRNLFGNMPVRVKQRAIVSENQAATSKEWDSLKRSVVLLLLAWPSDVAVILRDLRSNQKMIVRGSPNTRPRTEISRVYSILSQWSCTKPDEKDSWVSVSASTSNFNISGTFSLCPSPTKDVQFISFDIHPVLPWYGQSILHDEINRLFLNSAFGNEEDVEEVGEQRIRRAKEKGNGLTDQELKGGKKGVDRWPMFYINIQRGVPSLGSTSFEIDELLGDKRNSLTSAIDLITAMVVEFLNSHHFRPRAPRGQRSRRAENLQDDSPIKTYLSPKPDHTISKFAKSPSMEGTSPKVLEIVKKYPVSMQNTDPDLLSTNIKLPSFRNLSSTSGSPFDAWSKVKVGTARPAFKNRRNVSPGRENQQPSTTPPLPLSSLVKLKPPWPIAPLISSTGKITGRPFEDVPMHSSRSKSAILQSPEVTSSLITPQTTSHPIDLARGTDNDDTIAWTNPVTKVKYIVNKRTGHAISDTALKSSSFSRSLSTPNFPSYLKLSTPIPRESPPSPVPSPGQIAAPWISNLLQKWDNPIFHPTEAAIPRLSLNGENQHVLHGHRHNCSEFEIDRAFKDSSSGIQEQISKDALRNAEVISQVDRKFILVKLRIGAESKRDMLVIIDQHAADERIRIEKLLSDFCVAPQQKGVGAMPMESSIVTTYLEKGITFEVTEKDIELLRMQKTHFARWGICYEIFLQSPRTKNVANARPSRPKLVVRSVPPAIAERCRADPKLLIELIRAELYSDKSHSLFASSTPPLNGENWLKCIHTCPQGILDMLNSRACRSAIMFNDQLSLEQCEALVENLADTKFPFQCAHGRPSLLPLVELGSLAYGEVGEEIGGGFRQEFRVWKEKSEKALGVK